MARTCIHVASLTADLLAIPAPWTVAPQLIRCKVDLCTAYNVCLVVWGSCVCCVGARAQSCLPLRDMRCLACAHVVLLCCRFCAQGAVCPVSYSTADGASAAPSPGPFLCICAMLKADV